MTNTNTASRETNLTAIRYAVEAMNNDAFKAVLFESGLSEERHAAVIEKLESIKASMETRSNAPHKVPAKTAAINADIAQLVLEVLANTTAPMTMGDMLTASESLKETAKSVQKLSGIMRTLVSDGKVVKTADKRKSLFALA